MRLIHLMCVPMLGVSAQDHSKDSRPRSSFESTVAPTYTLAQCSLLVHVPLLFCAEAQPTNSIPFNIVDNNVVATLVCYQDAQLAEPVGKQHQHQSY